MVPRARRRPGVENRGQLGLQQVGEDTLIKKEHGTTGGATYLLLELLVDCVQRILDCHALQIPCNDIQSKREMQVNLLDHWCHKGLLQRVLPFF